MTVIALGLPLGLKSCLRQVEAQAAYSCWWIEGGAQAHMIAAQNAGGAI
jgi:hypothetical protein